MTTSLVDTATHILSSIVVGGLIGTAGHEALHVAAARAVGAKWSTDGLAPPRIIYALPAAAPRWKDYAIRLAPQALAWPAIALALVVGWPPLAWSHTADWATLVALGLGGPDDYALILEDARAWWRGADDPEQLVAIALVGSVAAAVGSATRIGWLILWGGILGSGILTGVALGTERERARQSNND